MSNTKPNQLSRRERRKVETRQQIFRAAMKLFEQKGIFGTTVEEITEAADVGKGTFFNYFPSKEAILAQMAQRQLGIIDRATDKAENAASIYPILKEMMNELSNNPGRSQIMLRSLFSMALSDSMLFEIFSGIMREARKKLARIIERGQEIGEVRADIPALDLARCLHQSTFGTSFIWAVSPPSNLAVWQERTMDLFWRGIATHPDLVSSQPEVRRGKTTRRNGGTS
jgi:AcrR family transcriptional regulator